MRKIALLSIIIVFILVISIFINSISIPAPTKVREYDVPIDKFL